MKIILYATLIVFLVGCGEKTITNTIITPGAAVGDIVGRVQLYNIAGQPLNNNAGAEVTLDNTPYTAITDSSGLWTLKNVPAGTYSITFSKTGFSYARDMKLSFVANGILYYQYPPYGYPSNLFEIADGTPDLAVDVFQQGVLYSRDSIFLDSLGIEREIYLYDTIKYYSTIFKGILGAKQKADYFYRGLTLLFGKSTNVSAADPASYFMGIFNTGIKGDLNNFYLPFSFSRDNLYTAGFKRGERIYCVIYCGSSNSVSRSYFDVLLNHDVYTGLGKAHSEIKSFICP